MPGKFTVCSVVAVRGIPCICKITPAVSGLENLSPGFLFFLENDDLGSVLGSCDSREQSRCTAADNDDSVFFLHFRDFPFRISQ